MANISHDAWLFAETAIEDLDQEYFTRREDLPVLKEAEAWGLFKCEAFATDIIIAKVELVKGEVLRKDFRACNRGANLVIEAAVAATRYLALRTDSYFDGADEDAKDHQPLWWSQGARGHGPAHGKDR